MKDGFLWFSTGYALSILAIVATEAPEFKFMASVGVLLCSIALVKLLRSE